jgi:Zn finger protein HypA/HybF involved in hydrogenase expression
MSQHDPYSAGGDSKQYECLNCLHRVSAAESKSSCPECGGTLRNVGVPRE